MQVRGKIVSLDLDFVTHKPKLTLQLFNQDLVGYDEIKDLDEITITLEKPKKKRSLSQNAYCWTLLQKLADKLDTTKEEIYREYIKDKGVFRTFSIDNEAVSTFIHIWNEKGLGWICEVLHKGRHQSEIIAYYGTSSYNSKQMTNYVEFVVNECKAQGIETLTLNEIARLELN